MTSLIDIMETGVWYALQIVCVLLLTGQLAAVIQAVRDRRTRTVILAGLLNLAFCFLLFFVLMDCCDYLLKEIYHPLHHPVMQELFCLPWPVYAGLEALSALFLLLQARSGYRYRRSHLTPEAIRETIDLLPEGVCFSAPDGTVLLSNLKMNVLCQEMTGSVLSHAERFWQRAEEMGEKQKGQALVRLPDGEAWRFSRTQHESEGKTVDQITAVNVTEQYRVIEELRQKNDHLQDIQRRMRAASDLSADMFVAQEAASARAALHNHLGQVLLMGRYYLEHRENTDARMVWVTTREMNRILLGEAREADRGKEDGLQKAIIAAKSIGVSVFFEGGMPESGLVRSLLGQAIQECAANTVKHAEGDTLTVRIEGGTITLTNNGRPPNSPIAESGGLLALRRAAEDAGCEMALQSQPVFSLTLRFPPS